MSTREFRSALARAFAGAEHKVWIGDKRHAPEGAHVLRDLPELARLAQSSASAGPIVASRLQAIGWVSREPLRAGLTLIRPYLAAGALLWVVLDEAPLLGAVSRALRLAPKADGTLTEACEALLLTGYRQPRVLLDLRPRLVLAANKRQRVGALDAFFEQPPP